MKFRLCFLLLFSFALSFAYAQDKTTALTDSLLDAKQYEQAIVEYTKILKKNPNNEKALRGRGFSFMRLEQWDKGIIDYKKATTINPYCIKCEFYLIIMLYRGDKKEQAIQKTDSCLLVYADTAKSSSFYAEIMTLKARFYALNNEESKAKEIYNNIVTLYPDSAWAYHKRAEFYINIKSKSEALKDIEKAIKLKNTVAGFHTLRGQIYYDIKYYDEALKSFTTSINLDSTNAQVYWFRGRVLMDQFNKPKQAYIDIKRAVFLDSTNWRYYITLQNIYHAFEDMDSSCWFADKALYYINKGEPDEESEWFKDWLLANNTAFCDKSKPSYYYQRGVAMYNLSLFDSAVAYYKSGLNKFPKHPILTSFRGNAYMRLQKWEEAERDYTRSMQDIAALRLSIKEQYPTFTPKEIENYTKQFFSSTYGSLSHIYLALAKYKKAHWAIDTAIAIEPLIKENNLYTYYNQKGRVYMAMGNYDDALEFFEKTKMLAPKNPLGYMNMALALASKASGKKEKYRQFSISGTYRNF